jgi:hypothetical protein
MKHSGQGNVASCSRAQVRGADFFPAPVDERF